MVTVYNQITHNSIDQVTQLTLTCQLDTEVIDLINSRVNTKKNQWIQHLAAVWYRLLQTPLKNKPSIGTRRNTNSRRVAIREGNLTGDFYK